MMMESLPKDSRNQFLSHQSGVVTLSGPPNNASAFVTSAPLFMRSDSKNGMRRNHCVLGFGISELSECAAGYKLNTLLCHTGFLRLSAQASAPSGKSASH